MNSKTAILIFANSSQAVGKFNALANGNKFIDRLNADTLKTVKKTKLPYFLITEKEQSGHTFGERFENAIQVVFDKGFENIITIGNDTPQLKPQHILEAKYHLDINNFIVGPSLDGGFYLMGITKTHFHKLNFLDLPWQTSYLQKNISLQITACGVKVIKLAPLLDLDSIADFKKLYRSSHHAFKRLLTIISLLLQTNIFAFFTSNLHTGSKKEKIYFNKGSPAYLSI